MLQNDTFCIFFSVFIQHRVLFFLNRCREKEALRKRRVRQQFRGRWKRRKLKKWDRLYSGVSFLIVAFIRGFLLPSVTATWFRVVKSRWWGNDHLSLALLSFSASRRLSRLSSSFLWGRGCAWWSDGSGRDPSILVLCFLLRGLQDLQHTNKQISKQKNHHQSLAVTKGEKITFQKKKIYTCTLSKVLLEE